MWYLSPDLIIFLFSIYLLIINIKFSVITYLDQNQWSLVVTVEYGGGAGGGEMSGDLIPSSRPLGAQTWCRATSSLSWLRY